MKKLIRKLQMFWWFIYELFSKDSLDYLVKMTKEYHNSPEAKAIKEYWDDKTVFVHRRALFLGFILGSLYSIWFAVSVLYILWRF